MRAYEKVLIVQVFFCVTVLALVAANEMQKPGEVPGAPAKPSSAQVEGEIAATNEASPEVAPAEDTNNIAQADSTEEVQAEAGASSATQSAQQDPGAGAPSAFLLCSPEEDLERIFDPGTGIAAAADSVGHLALYGAADPDVGTLTGDSYELLRGCLPQLAYTNQATVLIDALNPEAAGTANVSGPTALAEDGSLLTSFSFAGGVSMDQRLYIVDGALEVVYELTNGSEALTSVSLRTLVTPPPDAGPSRADEVPRFFVQSAVGESGVATEGEVSGEGIEAVTAPRLGAASDSSGRLTFGGAREPDAVSFAGTLNLVTGAPFRYAPGEASPLSQASSMAVYWLDENLEPGGSATFSYRYEPTPAYQGS